VKYTTFLLSLLLFTQIADAKISRFITGNPKDVNPQLHGPAFHFQGGGTDVDAAFQWMFDQVRGCTDCDTKIDVIVLRASGDDDYNDYLYKMKGVDSVETLILTSRKDSYNKDVIREITNAEAVFFAGGDQCNYVRNFKGTPVQTAVDSVYKRGGGIGGTSAGLAIQGQFSYDACKGSTRSFEALADPFHESISFETDFFHWANMENTLTDQHVVERDRLGRTLTFLARQIHDGKTKSILGVAPDRETSLAVDRNGKATVMGKGPAYFILADHTPEKCEPHQPLTYSNYKVWKRDAGDTFDLKNRPTSGYYTRSVTNGVLDQDIYTETPCPPMNAAPSSDAAELKEMLASTIKKCPYDFDPYKYITGTKDDEFIAAKTRELRRFLDSATRPDRLAFFPTLWELERKLNKPEEARKAVQEDVKRLTDDAMLSGNPAIQEVIKRSAEFK